MFQDQFGKSIDPEGLYLVDYSINSIFKYLKGQEIKINPNSNNVLWAELANGKMAIFSKEKFKSIDKKSNAYTFKMEVVDINGKNQHELGKLLAMDSHASSKAALKEKDLTATYARVLKLKKDTRSNESFFEKDSMQINSNFRIKK